jgi:hypothetical protein
MKALMITPAPEMSVLMQAIAEAEAAGHHILVVDSSRREETPATHILRERAAFSDATLYEVMFRKPTGKVSTGWNHSYPPPRRNNHR